MIGADPTCRDSQEKEAFSMHACSSPDSHSFFHFSYLGIHFKAMNEMCSILQTAV